jgi:hypothetical protein
MRLAARFTVVTIPAASVDTTPVATASSTVSVYWRRSVSSACLAWRSA